MTLELAIVFALLVAVVVLFATEKVPVDVITLLVLSVLTLTGVLTPAEAFSGFSNEVVIMLGSIFVLGGALQYTGVLHRSAGAVLRFAGRRPVKLMSSLMCVTGAVSAFINNTTVAAIFVPPASGLARRAGLSASKILMPLAFAAILGGTCTLIGTSTNIAVSGYIARSGLEPLGFFEILPAGLVLMAAGIGFMATVGWRLLPSHPTDAVSDPAEMRRYLARVRVLEGSPLVGERAFGWELLLVGFQLVEVVRGGVRIVPDHRTVVEAGDVLIVEGVVENLRKITEIEGLAFDSGVAPEDFAGDEAGEIALAEALVLPQSELAGATVQDVEFRQRYGLRVLAVHRAGSSLAGDLSGVHLREADVLLVHGGSGRVEALRRQESRLRLLGAGDDPVEPATGRRSWLAVAIFAAAVLTGASGLLPMSVAFLTGAVLVILAGCIPADKAREFIDWRLLVLIGGMTAFGVAMEKTGGAAVLADLVVKSLAGAGPVAVLAGLLVLTVLLTQPMSNAAAALVVLPVAIEAAHLVGADPRSFAIGVMLSASISFVAPLEPASLLVYGAGKYRMADFLKVGGLLTALLIAVLLVVVPALWPLAAG